MDMAFLLSLTAILVLSIRQGIIFIIGTTTIHTLETEHFLEDDLEMVFTTDEDVSQESEIGI